MLKAKEQDTLTLKEDQTARERILNDLTTEVWRHKFPAPYRIRLYSFLV